MLLLVLAASSYDDSGDLIIVAPYFRLMVQGNNVIAFVFTAPQCTLKADRPTLSHQNHRRYITASTLCSRFEIETLRHIRNIKNPLKCLINLLSGERRLKFIGTS